MRIDISKLSYTKPTSFNEEVVFDAEKYKILFPLKEILNTRVNAKITRFDDFINVHLSISSKVVLISAYTLVEFTDIIRGEDELNFVSEAPEYEDEDFYIYRGNYIDLDEYIFNLLSASVPLKPVKAGEVSPKSGKNYSVTSDENLTQEKKNKGNNKFDKLDDLDFD